MMWWRKYIVAAMAYAVLLTIIEGKEEVKAGSFESSSVVEEMVCSNTEGEGNCKVPIDDSSNQNLQGYDGNAVEEESDDDDDDDDDDDNDDNDFHDESMHFDDNDDCVDKDEQCQFWAKLEPSECDANPGYMLSHCKLSCRACKKHKRYSDKKASADGADLGEPQSLEGDGDISSRDIKERIFASQSYMASQIKLGTIDPELLRTCRNIEERCTYWSLIGECENNPAYMKLNCGPACFSCDMLSIEKRCPMDREIIGPDVWLAGDLDKMFRKLTSEPYTSKYDVKVHSSPDKEEKGPWVITMDNFVSNEEADRLIELGSVEGYERSMDIGEVKLDGSADSIVSKGRTSTNAWCSKECKEEKVVKAVNNRISNMTGIPLVNSEDLQLLRYEPGQFYEAHHDYIEFEVDRQGGVRILTVYLYLNDVEAGGGTNFPILDLTVMPKKGRVLIWPSVLDDNPNDKDDLTEHQALPVEKGIKFGANAWFHMRDIEGPGNNGC